MADEPKHTQRYEHLRRAVAMPDFPEHVIADMERDGWEVCAVVGHHNWTDIYFKRPVAASLS